MHAKTWGCQRFIICCQGLRLALYKGLHATAARLCTKSWLSDGVRQPRLTGKTCEDAQCSRNCSPEYHLRSRGGRRQASCLVSPGKGLPTSASTCCVSWPTERAEEQGRLPRGSWL